MEIFGFEIDGKILGISIALYLVLMITMIEGPRLWGASSYSLTQLIMIGIILLPISYVIVYKIDGS